MSDPIAVFFESGSVTGNPADASTLEERLAFIRDHRAEESFKRRAWPHFTAFVDASNVARWDSPKVWEVNEDKAKVRYLLACDAALRKLGYIPLMVSDANLRHLIDEPWTFLEKYGKYPHSTSTGRKADYVVLRALRSLPEAICVSRDRYQSPDELKEWPDVLADRSRFWAYRFEDDGAIRFFRGEDALAPASRRLAAKLAPSRA